MILAIIKISQMIRPIYLDESIGFLEFFRIKHYLEDLLQSSIDLGTIDALKEHLKQPILEDIIHVF